MAKNTIPIRTLAGQFCQCGRQLVQVRNMKMCGEEGCAADPAFCTCHPIGVVTAESALERLLRDVRGES